MRSLPLLLLAACAGARPAPTRAGDDLSERYVRTVLAVGVHDPLYVDAYYGPAGWRAEVEAAKAPLPAVRADAEALLARARALPAEGESLEALRARYLVTHLEALLARVDHLSGKRLSFDEEVRALYAAQPPRASEADFEEARARLERIVPGSGPLAARVDALRAGARVSVLSP
jgi:hypothetical protein